MVPVTFFPPKIVQVHLEGKEEGERSRAGEDARRFTIPSAGILLLLIPLSFLLSSNSPRFEVRIAWGLSRFSFDENGNRSQAGDWLVFRPAVGRKKCLSHFESQGLNYDASHLPDRRLSRTRLGNDLPRAGLAGFRVFGLPAGDVVFWL